MLRRTVSGWGAPSGLPESGAAEKSGRPAKFQLTGPGPLQIKPATARWILG